MRHGQIIDLVRHGETVAGRDCVIGSSDVALHARGWVQMWQVARPLAARAQLICTSPLQRCRVVAERLAQRMQRPLLVVSDFREMDFGDWEQRAWSSLRDQADWHRAPERLHPPGGESFTVFAARVLQAWSTLQTMAASRILLLTHAGVMRVVLCHVLGLDLARLFAFAVPHGAHACIRRYADRAELCRLSYP